MGSNLRTKTFTFHNEAVEAGDGAILNVGNGYVIMNVDIGGTSTDFTLTFQGVVSDGGEWKDIKCTNLSTWAGATSTMSKLYGWQFSLEGLTKVRVKLSAIADGNISVRGVVVN